MLKMQDDKEVLVVLNKALDQKLINMGLKDNVDKYLMTQKAQSCVENAFTGLLDRLKEFMMRMPDIAHPEINRILETIEQDKNVFMSGMAIFFKASVVESMKDQEGENLCERILNLKFSIYCRDYSERVCTQFKADIAVAAFYTFETYEELESFAGVIENEPDAEILMNNVQEKLGIS